MMNILVLNGSPRPGGNTAALVAAFRKGAEEAGHRVSTYDVARKTIHGCVACEYCHIKGGGQCFQEDDMAPIAEAIKVCDMLVLASPIYYFSLSAQLQAAIQRCYCFDTPDHLQQMALLLSSASRDVYDGAKGQYLNLCRYWGAQDRGVITAYDTENKSDAKLQEVYRFAKSL